MRQAYKSYITIKLTPEKLFEVAVDSISVIDFEYCTFEKYKEAEKKLTSGF